MKIKKKKEKKKKKKKRNNIKIYFLLAQENKQMPFIYQHLPCFKRQYLPTRFTLIEFKCIAINIYV